jgi:hypothetical protein
MDRLATGIRALALTLLLAVALAAMESIPPDPGWAPTDRFRFFLGIDLIFGAIMGMITATAAAMLVPPRDSRWTWPAGALCVVLLISQVGILATGLDSGLSAAQSWRASTPLPKLASPDARSVVLVSVDTWRADSLQHMPLLQSRTQTGRVYERALSPSSWTLPAMASLMTGLPVHGHGAGRRAHPEQTGVRTGISENIPTLAQSLREKGYVSAAVLSNPYLGANLGFHKGLDRALDGSRRALLFEQLRRSLLLGSLLPENGDSAPELVEIALQRWGQLEDGRSFLWVHLSEPHAPYGQAEPCEMPKCFPSWVPARRGSEAVDPAAVQALYQQDLAQLDVALEELLVHIDSQRTLVIVVGDHGEAFGPAPDIEHGHSFAPEITQVPLLVWGPGIDPGQVSRSVNLMDVHRAILEYADRGTLQALDPGAPDSLTPMASVLFGQPGSACSDGSNWLQDRGQGVEVLAGEHSDELAGCIPGTLPEGERLDVDGALLSLGYIE